MVQKEKRQERMGYESLHIMELLSVQCLQVDDITYIVACSVLWFWLFLTPTLLQIPTLKGALMLCPSFPCLPPLCPIPSPIFTSSLCV